jgi:hypothetical protein
VCWEWYVSAKFRRQQRDRLFSDSYQDQLWFFAEHKALEAYVSSSIVCILTKSFGVWFSLFKAEYF